jgi:uncharacterized membrane protein
LFGFAYGGVMPLYAILVRQYFGARIMGATFGGAIMASTLGMAIGPLAGGDLRCVRGLPVALRRLVRDRAGRRRDRTHVPAAAVAFFVRDERGAISLLAPREPEWQRRRAT